MCDLHQVFIIYFVNYFCYNLRFKLLESFGLPCGLGFLLFNFLFWRYSMQRYPMTPEGKASLEAELHHLKTVERPRITQAIAEAREHGDLKENAEYHAAREQQGFCEGRIQDIEGKLGAAQVIDVHDLPQDGRVVFGVTVTIENLDTEEQIRYKIVGDDEADFKQNKISVNSPIARGLIGKSEGDEVKITTPKGEVEYEIMQVEYV
jgi:transcription elongation factor GreA